jgi:hypothetical protein
MHTWAQVTAKSLASSRYRLFTHMSIVSWSLTIGINIYVTSACLRPRLGKYGRLQSSIAGAIVFRIWRVEKQSAEFRGEPSPRRHARLRFIMRIIVESALLYTGCSIAIFIAVILNSAVRIIAASIVRYGVSGRIVTNVR